MKFAIIINISFYRVYPPSDEYSLRLEEMCETIIVS
jgi:hypothetical protein